ncbi:WAT1-related protein [Dioscorea alata]|uniref:WAT1-related protein n=1 Tax=Dioscorea alata TaxID=55571 RepID=A0ACB7VR08_DIOAL|nr:WAT1-related protein [Dioscorea alata]
MAGSQGHGFGLSDDVLAVLPSDPFEQLDIARKITSIALATRVSKLEAEASRLRQWLAERDDLIAELRAQVETLDASASQISQQLEIAQQEKENLVSENASLSNTVKKLSRDVSKLEMFRKTLMQSLQEEDSTVGVTKVISPQTPDTSSYSTGLLHGVSKDSILRSVSSASHSSTPSRTPPHSPPRLSSMRSPARLSNPVSPRRHSISFSSSRNMFDERASIYSSLPSSTHGSMTSPFDTEPQTGRTRVDGKEFFRQVRSRLSYEQFSAFLANVKELNSHKQTREETLQKADEIFGSDNKDLYAIFESLISRNLH